MEDLPVTIGGSGGIFSLEILPIVVIGAAIVGECGVLGATTVTLWNLVRVVLACVVAASPTCTSRVSVRGSS